MIIFIPTRGRRHYQYTRKALYVDKIPFKVVMVVTECEEHQWDTANKLVIPDEYKFSDIRQEIVNKYWSIDPHHMCIDDDLKFYVRIKENDWHLRYTNYDDIIIMLNRIEKYLEDYAHGGISPRELNNRHNILTENNTRVTRCHFYNAADLHGEGFDFRDLICKQDFHMTLSMLELGYQNIVDFEFAQGQRGSQAKGGCERYRTLELMAAEAHKLKELHPNFIRVSEKITKGSWGGKRTDVTCYWKKSFCTRENDRKLYRE